MLKAVIWDIDGTLIDSEPLHLKALQKVCAQYNVDISDLPEDRFIGVNLHGVWLALGSRFPAGLTMAKWVDALNGIYAENAAELTAIPDATTVVKLLYLQGVRQAAVSNSNRSVVDTNLASLGIAGMLEFSMSLDDVRAGKPAPEPYLKALDQMKLRPCQALAVEDSRTGVCSARSAGIPVVGFGGPELEADWHIDSLRQVLELIAVE